MRRARGLLPHTAGSEAAGARARFSSRPTPRAPPDPASCTKSTTGAACLQRRVRGASTAFFLKPPRPELPDLAVGCTHVRLRASQLIPHRLYHSLRLCQVLLVQLYPLLAPLEFPIQTTHLLVVTHVTDAPLDRRTARPRTRPGPQCRRPRRRRGSRRRRRGSRRKRSRRRRRGSRRPTKRKPGLRPKAGPDHGREPALGRWCGSAQWGRGLGGRMIRPTWRGLSN